MNVDIPDPDENGVVRFGDNLYWREEPNDWRTRAADGMFSGPAGSNATAILDHLYPLPEPTPEVEVKGQQFEKRDGLWWSVRLGGGDGVQYRAEYRVQDDSFAAALDRIWEQQCRIEELGG